MNIGLLNLPSSTPYLYHFILEKTWIQVFSLTTLVYIGFNSFFGALFLWCDGISTSEVELSFSTSFFFSVQTMDTIGYGTLSPTNMQTDITVVICSVLANFFWILFGGLVFAKMSLPKRLKRTIRFSDVAVINDSEFSYEEDDEDGTYKPGKKGFVFRLTALMQDSILCDSGITLLYYSTKTKKNGWEDFAIHELDYEMNRQVGRNRDAGMSTPALGLPWTVVHIIDKNSPLYGKTLQDMANENGEVIVLLDAITELTSESFQARWSWTHSDIRESERFVRCVRKSTKAPNFVNVDVARLSKTEKVVSHAFQRFELLKTRMGVRASQNEIKEIKRAATTQFETLNDLDLSVSESLKTEASCSEDHKKGVTEIDNKSKGSMK